MTGASNKDKVSGHGNRKAEKEPAPAKGAEASHDSPKRQGDKLENARDAAAGRPKGK
jgi:hypothetical protein